MKSKYSIVLSFIFWIHAIVVLHGQTTVFMDNCNVLGGWTNTGRIFPANLPGYDWFSVDPIVPTDDHTGGGNCFYVNGNNNYLQAGGGSYIIYQLVSPSINLTGFNNTRLEFWMQMRSETGNWDGGYVEWSHNGVTWTKITAAQMCIPFDGPMSQNASSTPYYPLNTPAWFNPKLVWTRVLVDISAIDNVPSFRLRFTFHSDEALADRGWTIDDIHIVSVAIPQVQGNAIIIPDNDITPIIADGTDFGQVPIGQSTTQTFFIHNIGEAPLTLTGTPYVTATGTGFTILSQPATNVIPAGGSVPFTVEFSPPSAGTFNGTINIPNSDNFSACTPPNPYNFAVRGKNLNTAPYLTNQIPDTNICANANNVQINFSFNDLEQAPGSITFTANSSNPAVVANANINISTVGNNGTITITPTPPAIGSATISITLNDGQTINNDSTFTFNINFGDTLPPVALCQNLQVQLDAQGFGSITPQQANNGSSDDCQIAQMTLSQTQFTCADVGNIPVDFTVTDLTGNSSVCQLMVTVLPPPILIQQTISSYNGFEVSCNQGNDGFIQLQVSGGCAPYQYAWSNNPANNSPNANNLIAGNYTVVITDISGQSQSVNITLTSPTALTDASMMIPISCGGAIDGEIHLSATGGIAPYIYSTGPDLQNLPPGNYNYSITDANNCVVDGSYLLINPNTISITGDTYYSMYCGKAVSLDITANGGSGILNYQWNNIDFLDCSTCEDPVATPPGSMQFVVTVNDENGCNNQYAVIVEVECNLFIPNSFTPNTDGKNEKFHIYTGGIKALEFRIFNRWGEELFFTDDETQGWDGTYKGNLVPEGTYVYSVWLIMPDGTERDLKGMLQLIR